MKIDVTNEICLDDMKLRTVVIIVDHFNVTLIYCNKVAVYIDLFSVL